MSADVDQVPDANKLSIGEGVTIHGAVVVSSTVVVEGVLEGDITAENLIVTATGTISGRIFVTKNAEISGKALEKLDVKGLLILRAGGHVDGSISFGTLSIEQGASITGDISSTDYRINQQSSYRATPTAAKPAHTPQPHPTSTEPAARPEPAARLELSVPDLIPGPASASA
jgi:cytoskeletal protein CcmA (bactofilin family)